MEEDREKVTKCFQLKICPGPDRSQGESYQTLKKVLQPILLKLLKKKRIEEHPNSFYEATIEYPSDIKT